MTHSTSPEAKLMRQEAFLIALQLRGNYASAARDVGVAYDTQKTWREDEEFARACKASMEVFKASLMDEVVRRGRDGFEEPVIFQGRMMWRHDPATGQVMLDDNLEPIPLTIRKHSDPLLSSLAETVGVLGGKKGGKVGSISISTEDGDDGKPKTNVVFQFMDIEDGKMPEPDPLDD